MSAAWVCPTCGGTNGHFLGCGEPPCRELSRVLRGYEDEVIGWAEKVDCAASDGRVPETAARMAGEIHRLRAEVECLRSALSFYADIEFHGGDEGQRAREALEAGER
jgi:hypothetical protein